MKKKLQVFISSTYADMIEERQAAVSAVLNAGHIPAGMELFKSGDKSQKVTIQKWIQESDVYMLLLGGRYGSMDEESGKSYTHWEYDYAGEMGKRRFAIVITEKKLDEKTKEDPKNREYEHYNEYQDFKKVVLSNICKFYEDVKDIRQVTTESLKEFESDYELLGWVKAGVIVSTEELRRENEALLEENTKLKDDLNKGNKQQQKTKVMIGEWEYEELKDALSSIKIKVDVTLFPNKPDNGEASLLLYFMVFSNYFTIGLESNSPDDDKMVLYYDVAPQLIPFGLLEKRASKRIQTTQAGLKFLAKIKVELSKRNILL
ncbi:DUF4062 domain-containing protein [Paenibacillus typhae]|uniref:DUF4062 domain-containing protein n=1 Tax=Paenibacillus typhae TaxID=1174501 RepID=A0A1G8MPF8_9BACL|nr:DUF4062 domain-containing protein [Paenibacillus typhae]SDI69220.1 protein of unknown function [Paenibacillus typhae]